MNILLEQLKAAEAIEDEGLVNLIKKQIAYINHDHVPPETVSFRIHPQYHRIVAPKAPPAKPTRVVELTEPVKILPRVNVHEAPPAPSKFQENVSNSKDGRDIISQALERLNKKKLD
jgi:hypothetical protein